jgi:hypothetical protein
MNLVGILSPFVELSKKQMVIICPLHPEAKPYFCRYSSHINQHRYRDNMHGWTHQVNRASFDLMMSLSNAAEGYESHVYNFVGLGGVRGSFIGGSESVKVNQMLA